MAVRFVDVPVLVLLRPLSSAERKLCVALLLLLQQALAVSGNSEGLTGTTSSLLATDSFSVLAANETSMLTDVISPTPQTRTLSDVSIFSSPSLQTSILTDGVSTITASSTSIASPSSSIMLVTTPSTESLTPAATTFAVSTLAHPASQATVSLQMSAASSDTFSSALLVTSLQITAASSDSFSSALLVTSSAASSSPIPEESPTVPVNIVIANSIQVTLPSFSLQNFTVTILEQFQNVTADIINTFCSEAEANGCATVQLRNRRTTVTVQLSDVVISDVAENAEGFVQFNLHVVISLAGGEILQLQTLQQAIEASSEVYSSEGFGEVVLAPIEAASPSTAGPTTPSSGLGQNTIYVIVGIVALYTIAMALCMVAVLIAYKKKHSRMRRAKRMKESDMSAFNVVANPHAYLR